MTSIVVETGLPNPVMLLVVIRTMIRLIVVVSLIIVDPPDTTAMVLDPWIIAIIQPGLGRKTTPVVLGTTHHRVEWLFAILIVISHVVHNMVNAEAKKNIVEEVQISEGSQNLQKHAKKMDFVVIHMDANPT